MAESSTTAGGVPPNLPVKSPVAAPEQGKGPTEYTPAPKGKPAEKNVRVRLKKEAMGVHEQSGYQAPGSTFVTTKARAEELGERVEVLGEVDPEETTVFDADAENPDKNKPVHADGAPGAETPGDPAHK